MAHCDTARGLLSHSPVPCTHVNGCQVFLIYIRRECVFSKVLQLVQETCKLTICPQMNLWDSVAYDSVNMTLWHVRLERLFRMFLFLGCLRSPCDLTLPSYKTPSRHSELKRLSNCWTWPFFMSSWVMGYLNDVNLLIVLYFFTDSHAL